jgi:hypothetical protein
MSKFDPTTKQLYQSVINIFVPKSDRIWILTLRTRFLMLRTRFLALRTRFLKLRTRFLTLRICTPLVAALSP